MASNISDFVAKVRVDLEDPNPPATIWSDADLQRHVTHAVLEYGYWKPREVKETGLSLTAGSRDLSLASLTSLMRVLAAEYPTGQWPPAYVQFQVFGSTLSLFLDGAPLATDPLAVNLYCLERHQVDGGTSTVDAADDEVIAAGAAAFAAQEYAVKTAGQVNIAGPQTWLRYRDLAQDRATEFRAYLGDLRGRVTPQRAYAPTEPPQSRFTVEAPWRG
ncbi:MAG: hypothetical protein ACYDCQ_08570 [Dehalococcoidia bacterium]